jgi:hypothetical protein
VTDYTRLPDRNGEPIACHHAWHYAADGLPICHDGSQGRRCEGYTVQCGQGHAPCERHAARREAKPSSLGVVSYTVTLDLTETVVAELAIEARIRMLTDLRAELAKNVAAATSRDEQMSAASSYESCGESLRTAGAVLAKLKRAPGNSPALDHLIRGAEDDRRPFIPNR